MTFPNAFRAQFLASTAALAAALIAAPSLHAQLARAPLVDGSRVRITADSGRVLTGSLLRVNADTLTIAASRGAPLQIPAARLTSLDVSRGRNRGGWSLGGALIGGLVGGVLGGASGGHDDPTGLGAGAGFAAGGILGLLSGAVIGALVAPERWQPVALPLGTR